MDVMAHAEKQKTGTLPATGMLANAYVPMQTPGPKYKQKEALNKGTLFPGLDLPFKNMISTKEVANTPLGEIMALDFACHELILYLDTHPHDAEALELFNTYCMMGKDMTAAYEKEHGPLTSDQVMPGKYTWLQNPWPWDVK